MLFIFPGRRKYVSRLILVSSLLVTFIPLLNAQQQQQRRQVQQQQLQNQRRQLLTQRLYQLSINNFVDGCLDKTLALFEPGKPKYQSLVNDCGGKDSTSDVRATLVKNLTKVISDSLQSFFRTEAGRQHFGKAVNVVRRDCITHSNSPVVNSRISDFIKKICTPIPPTRTNRAPIANAGEDITLTLPVNYTTLKGSGADPERHPLRFRWSKISGDNNATVISPGNAVTYIENLTAGSYRYTLTVTDSLGASGYDTVTITVNAQRLPPVANAGPTIEITLPVNSAVLSGNGTDPQQSILSFRWTKVSGNGGFIVNDTSRSTVVQELAEGTYLFRLTVTNRLRLSASDTMRVIVHGKPNRPPLAYAGDDIIIKLPEDSVQLSGSGTDPDGDTLGYNWKFVSGPSTVRIASPQNQTIKLSGLEAGEYYFSLTVTDGRGLQGMDSIRLQVNPIFYLNTPPTVSAGPDLKLDLSESKSIQFQASASDSDGSIVSYQWEKLAGPDSFEFINADKAEGRIENPAEGEYTFQLTVTDNGGRSASDIVLLQVSRTSAAGISLWIIITAALGAGVIIWSAFKFLWFREKQKVIAYYLNEKEERLVHGFMPDGDRTEGFTIGYLSRWRIRQLKRRGIVFSILNTKELTVNTPGANHEYRFARKKGKYIPKGETVNTGEGDFSNIIPADTLTKDGHSDFPLFYIITLDSPLLPKFQVDLQTKGIEVLQRIPNDSYLVAVENIDQIRMLEGNYFPFIRVIRPYSPEDTGFFMLNERTASPVGEAGERKITVDLLLHRERDLGKVEGFVSRLQIDEWVGQFRNVIRVRARWNKQLAYKLASNKYIQAIYEHIPPVLHNDFARQLIGLEDRTGSLPVYHLDEKGADEIVAVADTGIDRQHPDLQGKIHGAVSWGRPLLKNTSDPDGHGTHVAGSIVGTGVGSKGMFRGIAPDAKIFVQSLIDDNREITDLRLTLYSLFTEARQSGARIMNMSWGSATEGAYTYDAAVIDQFVSDNPDMLIVVSAGNENEFMVTSGGKNVPIPGLVGSLATNKNGLTVGASCSNRDNDDSQSIASFSSRGPCQPESRIKPDIVAPGTCVISARSSQARGTNFLPKDSGIPGNLYGCMQGSSMAAAMVSGAAALVRQYYRNKKKCPNPSSALIKATLINGTRQLGSKSAVADRKTIPNNSQGFGMLDMLMTIPNNQTNFSLQYCDAISDPSMMLTETGKTKYFQLTLNTRTWLRICMVFLDNHKNGAQIDLNLIVGLDGSTKKWTGNEGINAKDRDWKHKAEDFRNNIEVVRMAKALPGVYTIEVAATKAMLKDNVGFALVVTSGDMSAKLTP